MYNLKEQPNPKAVINNSILHSRFVDSHNIKNQDGQDYGTGNADDAIQRVHHTTAQIDIHWNAFAEWDHSSCESSQQK